MKFAGRVGCALGLWLWAVPGLCANPAVTLQHITTAEIAFEPHGANASTAQAGPVPPGLRWFRATLPRTESDAAVLGPVHSRLRLWVRVPSALPASSPPQAVAYSAYMYSAAHLSLIHI